MLSLKLGRVRYRAAVFIGLAGGMLASPAGLLIAKSSPLRCIVDLGVRPGHGVCRVSHVPPDHGQAPREPRKIQRLDRSRVSLTVQQDD